MRSLSISLFTLLVALASPASAQVISGGGSWSSIGTVDNGGGEFWDNTSGDGTNCNVGFYATSGWGGCNNVRQDTGLGAGLFTGGQYYSNGGAATNFLFTGPRTYTINVLGGIGRAFPSATTPGTVELSEIGYYTLSGGTYSYYAQAAWLAYFSADPASASGALPGSITFGTSLDWGFYYIRDRNSDEAAQCDAALSSDYCSGSTGIQYWSVMKRLNENYFLVSADNQTVVGAAGDGDYNDYMFAVTASPEPASMALVATGLLGLVGAGYVRRRRN